MTSWDLVVTVAPLNDDDDEVGVATRQLNELLLDLELGAAELISATDAPENTKSISTIATTIGIRLGGESLKAAYTRIRDWAARRGRTVEVTISGDTIKITNATDEQYNKVVDAWLARHGTS
ncbi:hypothetical protein ABZV58_29120 [Nocardia sp. NPDC004654]|uniref:hypothetical protein n=1 Tax=Nocardia sp. NPDC004654 TaxID=3154776 RepID=UPI0033BB0EC0